jgi:hypothetical protein
MATQAPLPAAAATNNPCLLVPGIPFCDSALGPLVDVTANWQFYQPATVQPIPIVDFCPDYSSCSTGDPEDAPAIGPPTPVAAGRCGTETMNQPALPAPQIPTSYEVLSLPTAIVGTPPPGPHAVSQSYSTSRYCVLRYLATDFDQLCSGCHRVLLNYAAIPQGTYNATSPASDGHWAARFTLDGSFSPTTPFNAHSPNFKNLCSDKKFNSAPGSDCIQVLAQFDNGSHSLEGDSTLFHHFPYEGRYFNGPAYLAGTPGNYHWIQAAYFDVDPTGISPLEVFYNAGYRGLGDVPPDTDWSYGCACEVPFTPLGLPGVPGAGHTTWSDSLNLVSASASGSGNGAGGSPSSGGPTSANSGGSLPNTSTVPSTPALPISALAVLGVIGAMFALRRIDSARH